LQRRLGIRAERVKGISENNIRANPCAVFDDGIFWNKSVRVNANTVADFHMMLNHGMRPDADIIAYLIQFPNHDAVPGLEICADHIPCIDDRVRTYDGARADL